MIAVYCLILAFNGLSTTFTAVYQGTQQRRLRGGGSIIEKVLVCLLAIVLLWLVSVWSPWQRSSSPGRRRAHCGKASTCGGWRASN